MKSTNAWGWLATGVLALGLNGIYHDGGAAWAHRAVDQVIARVAERTGPVLALASGRADWFLAKTKVAAAQVETASCPRATRLARIESTFSSERTFARLEEFSARKEAQFALEEAQWARVETARARIQAQVARHLSPAAFDAVRIPAICPRVRVSVPRLQVSNCAWERSTN